MKTDHFSSTGGRAVDLPERAQLRETKDGTVVTDLFTQDISKLKRQDFTLPIRFASVGRDNQTLIYGTLIRPSNFNPEKSYPVIEHIYAGPHDFHVRKQFGGHISQRRLAELGFVVAQIDGMGTNWRSKKFHDVCWKNLSDAGLPDHIAWLKAAAKQHPWIDLSRVGIYGGSAGGQNALAAMLHHGEFYKAAASDCGCHDNRMDKIWWNEAWMGKNWASLQAQLKCHSREQTSWQPFPHSWRTRYERRPCINTSSS
jgi:dipeptidyl aminopeptidase/acylaminoacyl peptidase